MKQRADQVSQNIGQCLKDVKLHSEPLRKNFTASNEKSRSVGVLSEELATACETAASNQLQSLQKALLGFATTIERVELARKGMYQKVKPIGDSLFVTAAGSSQVVAASLKKRDEAIQKASILPPPDNDPKIQQNNLIRMNATSANASAIQETRTWYNQYNADLRKSLREYAYAQMEFAAKGLEQWSNFFEDLSLLDFGRDTDEVVSMLENGSSAGQSSTPQ